MWFGLGQKVGGAALARGLALAGMIASLALISGRNVGGYDSTSSPETTPDWSRPDLPKPMPQGCPNLDSRLYQLTLASDPATFAAQAGLVYRNGSVLAIVALQSAGAPPDAATYGLTPDAAYADLLQAWVPVDQLCSLAADSAVVVVRPPAQPVPDGPTFTQPEPD